MIMSNRLYLRSHEIIHCSFHMFSENIHKIFQFTVKHLNCLVFTNSQKKKIQMYNVFFACVNLRFYPHLILHQLFNQ